MPAPPLHQLTPSGSFNFKVEPILLHVNSSVPLLNHDQLNSSSSKTISSSSSEVPEPNPQPPPPALQPQPPPPKQETNLPPPNAVTPPPPPPPQPAAESLINPTGGVVGQQSAHQKHEKALRRAGSLANLLPTGTVLAVEALTPTLSNSGKCQLTNKILMGGVVIVCTIICFCSSFMDSFECKEKVYYGIATRKGLMVFNYEDREKEESIVDKAAKEFRYKVQPVDFVHAFLSVAVFLIFAFSSSQLQGCFFQENLRRLSIP
ncbi:hypothetical protein FEM48_Zijuj02G0150800 [Ziziphus jujuba var. spinosa]|uniref:Uncharacterized protein n=1 Tax=Ziziphus jujuba var. spinosa TaxID=714518 RepID=A0A978VWD6_ZIZJJ|nr:hypothetical protein FEM48_Zijuj02G0150800 [Ziziphus jujuba var. spinosa]